MKQPWALLLDLDQTLVFTDTLQSMRDSRQWRDISKYYHLTHLPEHTKAFLDRVHPHFQVGVVTASPRHYAEDLIKHHGLDIKVLTAYRDTQRHKPDPEPLLHASAQLNIPPSRCVHVGDHTKDIIAAYRAKMVPVALLWDSASDMSTVSNYSYTLCTSWYEVLIYLKELIKER